MKRRGWPFVITIGIQDGIEDRMLLSTKIFATKRLQRVRTSKESADETGTLSLKEFADETESSSLMEVAQQNGRYDEFDNKFESARREAHFSSSTRVNNTPAMSSPPEAKQQNNDNACAEDLEDWSLTFPSDLPESVAFEIPLEKKVSIITFQYLLRLFV